MPNCRHICSRNPGDVEDYFPQYLRHHLLDLLEGGDEGSGEEDDAEDEERLHRKEICSKVEQYLADLRWGPQILECPFALQ